MDLEDCRSLFATVSLVLILVVAFPALSAVVSFPGGVERFSELWLLGPRRMAEGYPFDVGVGEEYSIFVGVGNHMGYSAYYMVYVKFRNGTQPLPSVSDSEPSPLPPLYEFRFFVGDGDVWESPLTFAFHDVFIEGDSIFVGNVSINGMVFSVDCLSMWDSENDGFYYQLFFELWLYDVVSQGFRFHDRFVGLWLNVTGS